MLECLDNIYDPQTRPSSPSTYHSDAVAGTQPPDVLVFGPITAACRRIISDVAHDILCHVDTAHFADVYAKGLEKVLPQMSARKAFSDTSMTITPDVKEALS